LPLDFKNKTTAKLFSADQSAETIVDDDIMHMSKQANKYRKSDKKDTIGMIQ